MSFNKPLGLQLKSSKDIAIMIAIMHILVVIIILLMTDPTPVFPILLLIIILSGSYFYYYQWHVMRTLDKSILELRINALGDWSVLLSTEKCIKVNLLCNSFVSSYLMVLNFSSINSINYIVVITKNMLSKDELRHLRVRLKTGECMGVSNRKFFVLIKLLLYK